MFRVIFLTLVALQLYALEVTITKGMDNQESYSTITIRTPSPFLCEAKSNPYGKTKKLICSFSKIPKEHFKKVENEFFIVRPRMIKGHFFLIVEAKDKMFYKPYIFNLVAKEATFTPKTSLASAWVIVGYKKKLPFVTLKEKTPRDISIPFYILDDALPYVGSLDLKGNPVAIKNSEDVEAYVSVKKLFARKKYEDCIESADEILTLYPKTLFRSELLFYKIKSFYKLKIYENVIENAKLYLHEYSSSENVPETLLMMAVAYYKNGQYTDANYFFDRLFSEHLESVFAKWGYIYKGDMANDSGEDSKAEQFYKKALILTQDLEIASTAAFKLAQLYITNGSYDKATLYIDKILRAKKEFFYEHYPQAKEMMFKFSEANKFAQAAKIDDAILAYMKKREDDYESNLRYLGVWLAKTQNKQEALKALERYIKEFKDGLFITEVEKTRDALFFDTKEKNASVLLDTYDKLIATYKKDPIGEKALYEKVRLMLKRKMYSDVLQLKEQILALDETQYKNKETLIQKAALGLMENALENKQCQVVLDIQSDYNVTVSSKWDRGLYECFIQAGDYTKAKKIAKRNLGVKELAQKEKWLYRYIHVDFLTGNYSEVIEVSHDFINLVKDIDSSVYNDIYRTLFDAYERVGDFDAMVATIQKIEKLFGLNYKDIDRYVAMINVGVAKKDDTIIIRYAKKLYDLQQRLNAHAQSPFVEFALYSAYMHKEEYKKALEVIASLDNIALKKKQRARQKYLLGAVLDKLWRNKEAKEAYKASLKADSSSSWANLAKSALEIE